MKVGVELYVRDYLALLYAFKNLSGYRNDDPVPTYKNLLTQERLDQMMHHSDLDIPSTFARLMREFDNFDILSPENEAFVWKYAEIMGGKLLSGLQSEFAGPIIKKDEKAVVKVLCDAKKFLQWHLDNDKNIAANLAEVAENKRNNAERLRINASLKDQSIEWERFKRMDLWHPETQEEQEEQKLAFNNLEKYVKDGLFTVKELDSFDRHLTLYFKFHSKYPNLGLHTALKDGLVTIHGLNDICKWVTRECILGAFHDIYLRILLSQNCRDLIRAGLFSLKDAKLFKLSDELESYVLLKHKSLEPKSSKHMD